MKKILLFSVVLFSVFSVFAQHPIGVDSFQLQTLGNSKAFTKSKGAIGGDSGLINSTFSDTAAANRGLIKNYPGGQIRVGNKLYLRDSSATKWLQLALGAGGDSIISFTKNDALDSIILTYKGPTGDTIRLAVRDNQGSSPPDEDSVDFGCPECYSNAFVINAGLLRLYRQNGDSTDILFEINLVDTMYRKPGIDSIFFTINGREHAILDGGSGGGGMGQLTLAPIGSTPNSNAATIVDSTLNLEPASVNFGGVVTTGTQSMAGNKTWTGVQSITPGTLPDQVRAFQVNSTFPSGSVASYNFAADIQTTSSNATNNQIGFNSTLLAGATSDLHYSAARFQNDVSGIGTSVFISVNQKFNAGSYSYTHGTTVGQNVGAVGRALGGNLNIGLFGQAIDGKINTPNIGVLGMADNGLSGGNQIGGYFSFGTADPTFSSAALIADNADKPYNIITGRDNGANVFEVKDGGQLQLNNYTGSNFYGTLARRLGLDASGNVIQDTTTLVGGGAAVTVSSYTKNAGRDSSILTLSNGTRFAVKDSIGTGGVTSVASGAGLTGGPITTTGTIKLDTSYANIWTGKQTFNNQLTNFKGYSPRLVADLTPTQVAGAQISNSLYNAFGFNYVFNDGMMGMVYREGTSHAADKGVIKMRTSTDHGFTWSTATTILSDATYDLRGAGGGGVTPSGRLIVFTTRYNYGTNAFIDQGYIYSDDKGVTWSTYTTLSVGSNTGFTFYGAMIQVAGDTLMQGWSGYVTVGGAWTQYVIKSSDNGATWSSPISVVSSASINYNEASFIYLSGRHILGIVRKANGTVYRQVLSTDNGSTWTDQGDCAFDTQSSGNTRQVWLSKFIATNGRVAVACYYPSRSDLKMYVIYGYATDLISGVSGWNVSTKTQIGTFAASTALSYTSFVHPYNSQLGVGMYSDEITSSNAVINFVTVNAGDNFSTGSSNTFSTGLTNSSGVITSNLSTGVSGGQTLLGGTAANDDLTIQGTSHATKTTSFVNLQTTGGYVGINTTSPTASLDISNGNFLADNALNIGADLGAYTRTLNTRKIGYMTYQSYASNTVKNMLFNCDAQSGLTALAIGGGSPNHYAATSISLWTTPSISTITGVNRFTIIGSGNVGIGQTTPTSVLHIKAGTATASTAPLKFTAGVILTTPEAGVIETNSGNELYYSTSTTAASRGYVAVNAYVATATSLTADATQSTIDVTATGQTITLPTAVGRLGRVYTIKLTASGTATVATTSSQTVDGSTTYSLSAQYKYVTVQSNNANWIIIANN